MVANCRMGWPRSLNARYACDTARASLRVALVCAVLMALSSCAMLGVGTFNVAYDHADWLLQRMASRYVDFDAGQARVMHTGFSNLHAWHRGRELPLYADMMESAATRIEHGLKHEDVIWMMGAVNERWRAVSDRLAQTATPVLATLSAEQVAHMERKLADDN